MSRATPGLGLVPAFMLAVVLALVGTGCGADTGTDTTDGTEAMPRSGPTAQSVGKCPADSAAVKQATALGAFDLDGDGAREKLFVTAPGSPCPNTLFAAVGDGYASLPLVDPLDAKSFTGVSLPGHNGAVVRADAVHPRGGFQVHLYGYADGDLAELLVGRHPVFGFIATDSDSDPVSATCTDTGFEVTRAQPRESGHRFAWDLDRTEYTVSANLVTAGATTRLGTSVSPRQMREQHRAMLRHSLFANCPAT